MKNEFKWRRFKTCGMVLSTALVLSMLSAEVSAMSDAADAEPEKVELDQDAVRKAIQNHPAVTGLRTQVCQASSQIDLAKAGIYPKVNLRLDGGSSLSSHIERDEVNRRRFEDRDIDAVISVNQPLYDWGIASAGAQIGTNARLESLIGVELESERIAADIIGIMIAHKDFEKRDLLYQDYRSKLAEIAENIEAGVNAGALRISDLRSIKISLLDAEVAHLQVTRQMELTANDLQRRLQITLDQARPLYDDYIKMRPLVIPVIASEDTREVRRLNLNERTSQLELKRTKAERRPSLTGILETTLFDADSYSSEYEVVGRIQMNFPLYDGGSNKARQSEHIWRARNIEQDRFNLIRNHQTQTEAVLLRFDELRDNLVKIDDKIATLEQQLEGALAREGQTESEPLATASLIGQVQALYLERSTLEKDIEQERLRGIFFADQLGETLSLFYGASLC